MRVFKDLDEIFSHNTKESLWLLIDFKVYDVTNFKHPGGKPTLLMNSGQDATTQFEDIGHKNAEKYMKDLCIGIYEYDEGVEKKQNTYPKQVSEPEFSLAARIGLAMVALCTAVALFVFIDQNQ